MTLTEIYSLIIAAVPSLVAVISMVISACQVIKNFKEVKEAVVSQKEFEELKRQLLICLQENAELKKQIVKLVEEVTKVKQ